jgi:hypothetical protein
MLSEQSNKAFPAATSKTSTIKMTIDKQKDAEPSEPPLLHPEPSGESIILRPGTGDTCQLRSVAIDALRALVGLDLGDGSRAPAKFVPTLVPSALLSERSTGSANQVTAKWSQATKAQALWWSRPRNRSQESEKLWQRRECDLIFSSKRCCRLGLSSR